MLTCCPSHHCIFSVHDGFYYICLDIIDSVAQENFCYFVVILELNKKK